MLVKVSVLGVRAPLTYAAPDGTAAGDTVVIPPFSYEKPGSANHSGVVVSLGSDYAGVPVQVIAVVPGGGG
jgi:hypothetical protein